MDESTRRRYLDALGITVWVRRSDPPDSPSHAVSAQGAETAEGPPASAAVPGDAGVESPPDWVTEPTVPADVETLEHPLFHSSNNWEEVDDRRARVAQMDWDTLRESVAGCTACALHRTRTQAVFGVGNREAEWLIVGEAPGADEDRLGEPFVGRAGKLLDKMLLGIGLQRKQVFIANILKCRPPKNRDPESGEAQACRPFLERQIALVQPRVILSVGRISAQTLLACDTAVGNLRGRVHQFGVGRVPLVVTYHPAYLLRRPREKRKAWEDLKLAKSVIDPARS